MSNRTTPAARRMLQAAVTGALLIAGSHALGQSTSATLRGQVSLDAVPANGANVTATNVNTGLTRTVQAGTSGTYSVAGLPPGAYRIDVEAGGKTSTQNVVLQVGQTATLDLAVGAAQAQQLESVVVSADRLVEAKTSEVATYVSLDEIELLPQNSRNFLQFAETVPGIQFVQSANGQTELRSGAQSANGVNVYIDGVGQKNYVTRGGVGGQGKLADSAASNRGTRGNPFPQLAIGEYKVITSNYKAELDQVSSAAIVAVTKSGTNEFTADAFFDTTNEDWRAKDPREVETGTKAASEQQQYGVALGGPIMRDRMHFFVTYEKKKIEAPATVFPQNWTGPLPEPFTGLPGTYNEDFDEDLFFGKVDMTIGDAHLFELSAKYRDESDYSFGDNEAPTYGTLNANEDSRWDLRYQYTNDFFINDAHVTYEDASFSPRPYFDDVGFQLFNGGFDNNNFVFNAGGGNIFDDRSQKGWGFQDDVTFNAIEWAGYHTIKAGIKFKSIDLAVESQSPYNALYAVDINDPSQTPFRVRFGASRIGELRVASDNKQYGIYLQDDWDVTDRLQLNLGVRYDYEETPAYLDYVTPQLVIDAFNSPNPNPAAGGAPYAEALRLGGIEIEDYISTGNNRDAFDGGIAPRLGFSFDLTEDERHVVFGGAGRSYDRNVFEYLARETTKGSFPTYEYWFVSPTETPGQCASRGTSCLGPFDPVWYDPAQLDALAAAFPARGAEVFMLNNDIKTPYSDQFSLGIRDRFRLGDHDWQNSVSVVYNEYNDGIVFLLGQRYPDGTFRPPGTTWNNAPWGEHPAYQGQQLGNVLLGTNGVETEATQLLWSLQKPYTSSSGWGVTLAYTFTDAEENRLNAAKEDDTYVFDYPTIDEFGWNTSTGVPEHRLVMTGIFDVPWGINVSAKLNLATPMYYPTVNCVEAPDPNNCFWDSKKPDTTLGFKQLDLAAQKTFTFMEDFDLRIRFDLLNVFNWENPDGRDEFSGGFGSPNENFLNPTSYLQPTRTFKLSLSANWR